MSEKAVIVEQNPQTPMQKIPQIFFVNSPNNRHTPINAPETLRAFADKCGTVRGPIKAPLIEKPTGRRQQTTDNRQQTTDNRQQLYTSSK